MATKEEHDDLEYHVTFPTPTPGSDQIEGFEIIEGILAKRETAVMMVGWMACEDKYLSKYSKVYEEKGCTTVRYSPTTQDVMGGKAPEVAKKLLEVLIEMSLSDHPVLFHIFSNGGCAIYNAMREELKSNEEFEEIVRLGVVYDSAPGRPHLTRQIGVVFTGYQPGLLTTLMKVCYMAFGFIGYSFDKVLRMFGMSLRKTIYDKMLYSQDGCPELYLYSEADEIILSTDIDELIACRRLQSVDIVTKRWSDSQHVQHLRKHKEEYVKACYDFLHKCLLESMEGDDEAYVDKAADDKKSR